MDGRRMKFHILHRASGLPYRPLLLKRLPLFLFLLRLYVLPLVFLNVNLTLYRSLLRLRHLRTNLYLGLGWGLPFPKALARLYHRHRLDKPCQ